MAATAEDSSLSVATTSHKMRSTIPSNPPLQTTQIQSQGQDAIADNILPTDVDDLLSGLGADDLDDFGDIDGADIEVDRSFESEVGSVGSFGPGVDVRSPVNPPESSKTITVGFSTGGGKVLAPPSRTAMEKARKMWTAEEENSDGASEHEPQDERERAKKPRLTDPSEPTPVIVGFSTGRGVAMPPPSAAAMKKAAQILAEIDMHAAEEDPSFPTNADAGPSRLPQQSPQVVFSLASGKPAPKPSEASLARARQLTNEAGHGRYDEDGDIREPFRSLTPNSHLPQSTPPSAGFQLASGKPAPKPNAASLARARQLMQEAAQADTSDQRHVERRQNSSFPHVPPGDTSPQRTPPGAGFQLASGKKPPAPSDASLAEARRLMDGVNGHLGSDGMPSDPIEPDPFRPLPSNGLEPQPAPPASGFQLASGKQAAPVSESSLAEARLLLSDDGSEIHQHAQPDSLIGPTTGFTMGSGKPAPPIKPASLAAVRNLFGDEENQQTFAGPCLPTTGLTLGSGKAASTPSQSSMAKAVSLFNDIDTNTATPVRPRPQPPIRANSPALTPLIRNRTGILPPTTPLRTPSATANSLSSIKRPIAIKTPSATSAPRRIGLGSTPSQHRIKKGFSTPFKTPQATRQVVPSDAKPVIHYQPVFNLERKLHYRDSHLRILAYLKSIASPERQTYKSAFLHPQYYSIEELEDMKIPDEIWQIGAHNAALYCFYTVGSSMGHEDALLTLRAEGCTLATARWVENHWIQILWKIAGTIQAKPDLFLARWSYDEVINQLRYRYEREYGNAQRPILKRIQEHDSSPSLPMVLFVYAIEYGQGEDAEKCFLELSDGWYRIRAMIDDCLLRAVRKGKLTVGRKLAVTGAKLESGNDGTEVLDAFRSSHLTITGNSTSLARWHTRLGLHSHPFIASLGSLSIDGGAVTLMDIVLEKVFPIAFMNGDKGNKEAPWGEEEEQIRQDAWTDRYTAERTRLQEEMRRQMDKMEDLASLLVQSAEESDPVSDEPPDGLESEYDDLLEAKNVLARLKGMSSHHIVHLARYAQARYNQEMADQQGDIERDLAKLCPPRDVRDFRMVRFVDAQTGVREQFRVGMLNVWDVRALGEGCLQEGKRYLVSNLLPARSGEWTLKRERASKAEIYLHTRRDTRWQPI